MFLLIDILFGKNIINIFFEKIFINMLKDECICFFENLKNNVKNMN